MLTIDVDMKQFNAPIERFLSILAHPKPILLQAIKVGQESINKGFITKGYGAWKERSSVTEKILENQYGYVKGELMRISTHLMNATGLAGQTGADGAIIADDNMATLENRTPYARKLHYGDPGGEPYVQEYHRRDRGNAWRQSIKTRKISARKTTVTGTFYRHVKTRPIPPRPFMVWQTEDVADVEAYCIEYIQNRIGGTA